MTRYVRIVIMTAAVFALSGCAVYSFAPQKPIAEPSARTVNAEVASLLDHMAQEPDSSDVRVAGR